MHFSSSVVRWGDKGQLCKASMLLGGFLLCDGVKPVAVHAGTG